MPTRSHESDRRHSAGTSYRDQVGRARLGLQRLGVGRGDRVAAQYLPNVAGETIIAFLATSSLGAVCDEFARPSSVCRPVLDGSVRSIQRCRWSSTDTAYGSREIDRRAEVQAIREAGEPRGQPWPSSTWVTIQYREPSIGASSSISRGRSSSSRSPADHPLYVLYSSGTTGMPKPIVHGHGGILLEHLKVLGLHADLRPGDRFFWFTTTGWMMWNYVVSGLLTGAAIVTFDGDPALPTLDALWHLAEQAGITWFGASAPYFMACRKAELRPGSQFDLSKLRSVGSTGAPLPADGFHWIYDDVGRELMLSSISGGTDVCSAFVGGADGPGRRRRDLLPVSRSRGRGVRRRRPFGRRHARRAGDHPADAVDACRLLGRRDGSRLRAAYFETYPGRGDMVTG